MQTNTAKVWYKQFWPWFLIIVPLTSMVLSFTMMRFAFNTQDSMVIDDYYKEGRGINLQIQKIERAKILNISTLAQVNESSISVSFVSGSPEAGQVLTLDFIHATQDFKDFTVTLLRDATGTYRAPIDNNINGKWQVSLHPQDQEWKINKELSFPQKDPFILAP
jgi:hypothetical protein